MQRRSAMLAMVAGTSQLASCGWPGALRIGFLGGLATQGFSVSEDGRNGAEFAVEEVNAAGGVRGRMLELLVRETADSREASDSTLRELHGAGAVAVVGPFTSTQTLVVLPAANSAGILLLSPTANAPALIAQDDQLVRLNGSLLDSALAYAKMLAERGLRRVAVAFDASNRAYALPWTSGLRDSLAVLGGEVIVQVDFASGTRQSFAAVAERLLAPAPQVVLFICRGSDAALLAQQIRLRHATLPMAAAEWAATESLIELGGGAVDGLVTAQPYDPADASPRYQAFLQAYRARHGRDPGFGALGSHDAVQVLAQALGKASRAETPKEAVLRHGPYQGLQGSIAFDRFGDTRRPLHFITVRDRAFVALR